jgi:hypothetical protein
VYEPPFSHVHPADSGPFQSAHPLVMAQSTRGVGIATTGTRVGCVAQLVSHRTMRVPLTRRASDEVLRRRNIGLGHGRSFRQAAVRLLTIDSDSPVTLPRLFLHPNSRPLHL